VSTTGIIIKREFIERIKSRSFIIGTLLIVAGMFLLALVPLAGKWLGSNFTPKLVIVAPDQAVASAVAAAVGDSYEVTISKAKTVDATLPVPIADQVKSKKYDAALVAYRTPEGLAFAFYPRQANLLEKTRSLRSQLVSVAINADLSGSTANSAKHALDFPFKTIALNERYKSESEETLAGALVYVLLILLYGATILYGVQVAQGVIEEKSNRVMEVMIGAVRPAQLLAGKIFGIGALALTQMVIFALGAAGAAILLVVMIASTLSRSEAIALAHQAAAAQGGMAASSSAAAGMQSLMAGSLPVSTLIYLVVFFLIGFFSYAALFAGIGALCSKSEDVQQLNGIAMIPIIAAYIVALVALMGDPDKPLIAWASMIPLISPMVMFTRVATSSVPAWQVAVSIGLSLVAIWALTLMAGKLYRVGVLMYGKPPKLIDMWRAIRAPS
jgi:ABC-2 type transport system permease protein